ncbi:hypothetical protein ACFY05_32845 [Microtetraspora fusca]|uniref:HTH araC/xylS-type domain-containing protein n=1 Tax=Microtetraspora fusca TaxID=1997 RepID=A0ABW6VE92_MICFU
MLNETSTTSTTQCREDLAVIARTLAALQSVENLTVELDDNPSDVAIDKALASLRALAAGIPRLERVQNDAVNARQRLAALLVNKVPRLQLKLIARAAGFSSDSYLSRLARRFGGKPRTYRQRKNTH